MASKSKNTDPVVESVPALDVPWKIIHIVELPLKNEGLQITVTEALETPHGCLVNVTNEYWAPGNVLMSCCTALQYLPGTKIEEKEGRHTLVAG